MPDITTQKHHKPDGSDIRDTSIDTLRGICILAVVVHHAASLFIQDVSSAIVLHPNMFWVNATLHSATKIAVPLFIMMSGRLLIGRSESNTDFYRKRAQRILIPLVFWSIAYSIYNISPHILYDLISGTAHYHIWYIYMLAGLYLTTPFITLILKKTSINPVMLGSVLLFCGMLLNAWAMFMTDIPDLSPYFSIVLMIGYYVLGYGLSTMTVQKNFIPVLSGVYVLCTLFTALLMYSIVPTIKQDWYFNSYLSPVMVISSLSVYVLFLTIKYSNTIFQRISPYTLGIYLVHVMILEYIVLSIQFSPSHALANIAIISGITFVISWGIVTTLSRIPLIRRVI